MFGLFKKECPVNDTDRKWVEDTLLWLHSHLNDDFFAFQTIPAEVFKKGEGKTRAAFADLLFEEIRRCFKIPQTDFELVYYGNITTAVDGVGGLVSHYKGGQGTSSWSSFENDTLVIHLQEETLRDLDLLAANLSYFLSLHKLKYTYNIEEISGYHVDLAAIVFGSGIFISNAIISHGQWNGVRMHGWTISTRGFITQQMSGYAMHLLELIKKDPVKPMLPYICPDVRGYIEQASKYTLQNKEYYSSYLERLGIGTMEMPDYYHEKLEYYDRKIVRSIGEMKNSAMHGTERYFYRNGKPLLEREYKNGSLWNVSYWLDKDGNPLDAGTLKDGNGTLKLYDDSQRLFYVSEYENGRAVKELSYHYYKSGELFYVAEMKNGVRDGLNIYYHANGNVWSHWIYKEGVPWTAICNYNQLGEKVEHGTLSEGNGILFSYDTKGILIHRYHYENGKLTETENLK